MTSPEDAARTTRDGTNQRIHRASELEAVVYGDDPVPPAPPILTPPEPVPMGDPIEDVTADPEGE